MQVAYQHREADHPTHRAPQHELDRMAVYSTSVCVCVCERTSAVGDAMKPAEPCIMRMRSQHGDWSKPGDVPVKPQYPEPFKHNIG